MTIPEARLVPVRAPIIAWDVIVSIVLLVLLAVVDALTTFSSLFLVMASDSCGSTTACSYDQITVGWLVAMFLPSVLLIATVVVAIVRFVKRRVAWWIVLIGGVAMLAAWGIGVALVFTAVPTG